MKSFLILFLFGAFLPAAGLSEDSLYKNAVLTLPDEIEYEDGRGVLFSGKIGFRWDEEKPLKVSLWRHGDSRDQLMIDIEIFDDKGKQLNKSFFVSIPPPPSGEVTVSPGERKQFAFFMWNGFVTFSHAGEYCAIATFKYAWMGKTNVVFTTPARWFKAVEKPAKKTGL